MTVEQRLQDLGISLPQPALPIGSYLPFVISGNLLFVSGQISVLPTGERVTGILGAGIGIEDGQQAARYSALMILAQARAALGSLERVTRIVRLNGFVAATPSFTDHPKVINGASDLMVAVFAEKGAHSRCALGVASLPLGAAVEIDAVIEFN